MHEGHREADVWTYTPRRLAGYVELASRRRKRSLAETLSVHATAAQGSSQAINKRIKELSR